MVPELRSPDHARPPAAIKCPNQKCQTWLVNSPQGEAGFSDTLSIRQLLKSISLRNCFLSADEGWLGDLHSFLSRIREHVSSSGASETALVSTVHGRF